jgi:hypothetical protein
MHGGRSTGARTEAGLARLRAPRSAQGAHDARMRARHLLNQATVRRARLLAQAVEFRPLLPPELRARLLAPPPELHPPAAPRGLTLGLMLTERQAREASRLEAARLAPWQAAVVEAREARRALREARRHRPRTMDLPATPHAPSPAPATRADSPSTPCTVPPPAQAGSPATVEAHIAALEALKAGFERAFGFQDGG